jgi:hypothetical protein
MICFCFAAAGVNHPRCSLGWLGAFFVSHAYLPVS